jgi:hypothetical protein
MPAGDGLIFRAGAADAQLCFAFWFLKHLLPRDIPLNYEERTGHLPRLMHDVIVRLRRDEETKALISEAAADHGRLRHRQGYPVEMLIEESRLLQVSIFTTLHNNVKNLEFSTLLPDIVTIGPSRTR